MQPSKKAIIISLTLLATAAIVGGFWYYSSRLKPAPQSVEPKSDPFKEQYRPTPSGKTVNPATIVSSTTSVSERGVKKNPAKDDVQKNPQLYVDIMADDDKDGLTNPWEARYETDPKKTDTDNDGLSDYEEAMIYFSNPKVADTDKDGNSDGDEVKKGFSPIDDGKLKNPPIKK
ncbi:hypothetical protein HGA34_00195 [Candidatus Falkowbacteria bacterium]|nr:hypothetical protein [Candidatus Falkowbacteria bacterium]